MFDSTGIIGEKQYDKAKVLSIDMHNTCSYFPNKTHGTIDVHVHCDCVYTNPSMQLIFTSQGNYTKLAVFVYFYFIPWRSLLIVVAKTLVLLNQ